MRHVQDLWRLFLESFGSGRRKATRTRKREQLSVEVLEDRVLLAWSDIGPAPQQDPGTIMASQAQSYSGRISALAISDRAQPPDTLILGAAGGGVWTSDHFVDPEWTVSNTDTINLNALNRQTGLFAGLSVVGALAVDPKHPDIVYLGTGEAVEGGARYGSGILRSDDGGKTWGPPVTGTAAKPTAFFRHTISKIVVDPNNDNIVYAAVTSFLQDFKNAGSKADNGIYQSKDGGKTWTKITGPATKAGDLPNNADRIGEQIQVTDLVCVSRGGKTFVYAGVQSNDAAADQDNFGGIWQSDDDGKTWDHIGQVMNNRPADAPFPGEVPFYPGTIWRMEFTVDDRNPTKPILYAIGAKKDESLAGIYTSTDGEYWTVLSPKPANFLGDQGRYSMAIAFEPVSGHLFVGGQAPGQGAPGFIYEYDPVTTEWTRIDNKGPVTPHADVQAMIVSNGKVYVGTDGGLWRYDPAMKSWLNLNTSGLETSQAWSVSLRPTYSDILAAGLQDNGIAAAINSGSRWTTVLGGDGMRVRFATDTGSVLYGSLQNGNLKRMVQPSYKWQDARPAGWAEADYPFRAAMDVNYQNPNLVLLAQKYHLMESNTPTDRSSWKRIDSNFPGAGGNNVITATTFGPFQYGGSPVRVTSDELIYVGFENGNLFRTWHATADPSQIRAKNWYEYTNPPWGNRAITSIATVPSHPGWAFLTIGNFIDAPANVNTIGQVYFTTNDGITWNNIAGKNRALPTSLPNLPAWSIAVQDESATITPVLYVGNDAGVWRGRNVMGDWQWDRFDTGLPNVQVMDLSLQQYGAKTLLAAGTYGRSVWTVPLNALAASAPAGVEGALVSNVILGTLADTGGAGPYTVSINWGDNTPVDITSGSVSGTGTKTVKGSHTWKYAGNYSVMVTVTSGSTSVILTSTAVVTDAGITAVAQNVSGSAWSTLSGVQVATFSDPNPYSQPGNFQATIDWGDGTFTPGVVSGGSGSFSVNGSHTYEDSGPFPVSVNIFDRIGGATANVSGTATLSGAVSAVAIDFEATVGTSAGTVQVSTFTGTTGTSYTALIDWGDGQTTTTPATALGGTSFSVSADHTYKTADWFPVTIAISESGGLRAIVNTTAYVSPAPLTAVGTSLSPVENLPLNNVVVARFTDPDPTRSPEDYTATIDWGDGAAAGAGFIVAESNGSFAVMGSHTYTQQGTDPVIVTIEDQHGNSINVENPLSVIAAVPIVTGLDTIWGPPQGGTTITIAGNNLFGATAVSFGGTAATAFKVNDDGSITAVAPVLTAGTYDITVTTPTGTSSTSSADQFTAMNSAPSITSLTASSGPTGGGNAVVISGTNMAGANKVMFGSLSADGFHVDSATQITAYAPASVSGTVNVTVTNPYSTSSASTYTYSATAPTVSALDNLTGPSAGGTLVTISGVNLNGASAVSFGSSAATSFTAISSTTIIATAPALSAGTVHVTVTTSYGTSSTSSADQFTAIAAPTISSLSSSSGPTGGGNTITLTGTNFTDAYDITFYGISAAAFTVNSATSITVTAPPSASGSGDIVVFTPGGPSAAASYTYTATGPSVSAIGPSRGPLAGGTAVTLAGANFNGSIDVKFGSLSADYFTVDSATQITAYAPAESAGTIHITVITPYGTSSTSSADQFTFADAAAPEVTGVSVSGTTIPSGSMAGGTTVVLTGSGFTAASRVMFGDLDAASVTVNSDTQITATTAAHFAGTVDVSVETPYGSSPASPFARFSYLAAVPAVSSISVSTGTTAGGTTVNLIGSGFTETTLVSFGGMPATFTVNSDTSITAVSPVQATGAFHITVASPNGTSTTSSADLFTYTAATCRPSPAWRRPAGRRGVPRRSPSPERTSRTPCVLPSAAPRRPSRSIRPRRSLPSPQRERPAPLTSQSRRPPASPRPSAATTTLTPPPHRQSRHSRWQRDRRRAVRP